jgi:plasmid stabilization system protein ParE
MRIRITPEAEAQLEERKRWWRQHRDKAPDRFDQEFVAAARRISTSPMSFPVFTEKRGRSIRRCLMPKVSVTSISRFSTVGVRSPSSPQAVAGVGKAPRFRLQEDAR